MLVFILASLLVAPSSGQPWAVTLRPAVVVQEAEADVQAEELMIEEAPEANQVKPPRLAPAKTEKPKSRPAKRGSRRTIASIRR